MAAKMSVLGRILSYYPYLKSPMVWFLFNIVMAVIFVVVAVV